MKSRFKDPVTTFMVNNPFIGVFILFFDSYVLRLYDVNKTLHLIIGIIGIIYLIIDCILIKIPSKEEREQIKKDKRYKFPEYKADIWTFVSFLVDSILGAYIYLFEGQKFRGIALMCLMMLGALPFSIQYFYVKIKKTQI